MKTFPWRILFRKLRTAHRAIIFEEVVSKSSFIQFFISSRISPLSASSPLIVKRPISYLRNVSPNLNTLIALFPYIFLLKKNCVEIKVSGNPKVQG